MAKHAPKKHPPIKPPQAQTGKGAVKGGSATDGGSEGSEEAGKGFIT